MMSNFPTHCSGLRLVTLKSQQTTLGTVKFTDL